MEILILSSIFCLIIFFFVLYVLSSDDFVFLRKNVSVEKIFNLAFLTLGAGIFSARLFYVILHFDKGFLNPFVFFLFPYFPGLNLSGGIIGSILFIFFYTKKNKSPASHITDILTLSFYSALPFGFIVYSLLTKKTGLSDILFLIILAVTFFAGMKLWNKSHLQDGSITILMLIPLTIILFLFDLLKNIHRFYLQGEHIILFVSFFLLIALFIKQEKIITRIKK